MNNFANRRICHAIHTIIFSLHHKNSRRRLAIDDIPTTPINHQHHHIVKACAVRTCVCVYVYDRIYICIIFIVITIFRDNFFHLSVNKTLTEVIICIAYIRRVYIFVRRVSADGLNLKPFYLAICN